MRRGAAHCGERASGEQDIYVILVRVDDGPTSLQTGERSNIDDADDES